MKRGVFVFALYSDTLLTFRRSFSGRVWVFPAILTLVVMGLLLATAPASGQVIIIENGSLLVSNIGDVDGDSASDLAVDNVFSGADGSSIDSVNALGYIAGSMGDINGDEVPDIAAHVNGLTVFSGADSSVIYTLDEHGEFVTIGDIDDDSVLDFALEQTNQALLFSGLEGSFLYTLEHPRVSDCWFSSCLVSIGDVNGDSVPDMALGNPSYNYNEGQVLVYSGINGDLIYTISNPDRYTFGLYSDSIAGIGDINDDTVPDLAVYARVKTTDGTGYYRGRVILYSGNDGTPIYTIIEPYPPGSMKGTFGLSMADVGDIDGDSIPDIAVASFYQIVNDILTGQVFVFSGANGELLFTIDNPDREEHGAKFGFTIASMGDVNGDSYQDLAVGAVVDAFIFHLGDMDGDLWYYQDDCDDQDITINPGAEEICDDSVDNDCDGKIDSLDTDALEICTDGIDNDCDGQPDPLDTNCGYTPAGTNVTVDALDVGTSPSPPVTVTFSEVYSGYEGNTTVVNSPCGAAPWGFELGDPPVCFDIVTTAAYALSIEVCVDYSDLGIVDDASLALLHEQLDGGVLSTVNTTTYLDTTNDVICGWVPTLSLFGLYNHAEIVPITIDIKPGNDPNCFNNDGKGVIPVGILGSADLDVYDVSVESLMLEGMTIRVVGKGSKTLANYEDINADGIMDLIVQIEDQDGAFTEGTGTASIRGELLDGTTFIEGTDSICVVP